MKLVRVLPFLLALLITGSALLAQTGETVWFDGQSRSFFSRDALGEMDRPDTTSPRNLSEGYNLLDINTHIEPADNLEVFAQLRVRNRFGGFFGAGTTIDVRQLRASGVIKDKVRFSIGDLYLKQSRFTLFNPDEDLVRNEGEAFRAYRDIVHYENFYQDNRWRLQGIQTDFSMRFDRSIRTLEFDAFLTRPRGSESLTSTLFTPDLLMAGGSVVSQMGRKTRVELNWVNLFEVPSSGTTHQSLRNPVVRAGIERQDEMGNWTVRHAVEGGYAQRHWLFSQLEDGGADSSGYRTEGVYIELRSEPMRMDSLWSFHYGVRHVDPGFRSGGAQTRRLDLGGSVPLTVYPIYSDEVLDRPVAMFDLMASDGVYNQMLSATLMEFHPVYSNVLPYGDATPNRQGAFLQVNRRHAQGEWEVQFDGGAFREIIGQGTPDLRQFNLLAGRLAWRADRTLGWNRTVDLTVGADVEQTSRRGESLAAVDLSRRVLDVSANVEVADRLFLQGAIKRLDAEGNEFITERNGFGSIRTFRAREYDVSDHILSAGLWYAFSDAVYANVQYSGWGSSLADPLQPDFNYRRLLFVFSVRL